MIVGGDFMDLVICLLGPSIISMKIYKKINSEEMNWASLVGNYFLFIFFNHLIVTFFSILLFGANSSIEKSLFLFPLFAVKYSIISVFVSLILPFLFKVVRENVSYSVEVKKNEKHKKLFKKDN